MGAARLPAREVRHLRTDLHDRALGVLNLMHDSYCTSDDALEPAETGCCVAALIRVSEIRVRSPSVV